MTATLNPPLPIRPPRLRWTGREFDQAADMGLFGRRRVELIDGDILEQMPMNEPHAYCVQLGTYLLMSKLPPQRYTVRIQLPMRLGEERPLPDFAVVAGPPRDNSSHPETALLVIEVSDATLAFDLTDKAELYAANGIPEYWLADVNAKRILVHRKPQRDRAGNAVYADIFPVERGATVTALNVPELVIGVDELIP